MKSHNLFSYTNVAESKDAKDLVYEYPLWVESKHSRIFFLKNFFRQNWGKERGVGTTLIGEWMFD